MKPETLDYFKSKGAVLYLEPLKGTTIDNCAEEAVLVGWDLEMTVIFVFNEHMLVVDHGDSPTDIVRRYYSSCNMRELEESQDLHPLDCGCTDCCIGESRPMTQEEHALKYRR
jgi:hypothetical protein